jgi:hypothetical protein
MGRRSRITLQRTGFLVAVCAVLRYNTHMLNSKAKGSKMLKMYTLQRNNTYLIAGKFVPLAVAQKNIASMYKYKTMLAHATQSIKQAGDTVAVFTL